MLTILNAVISIVNWIFQAGVLVLFYRWFVLPIFPGLPESSNVAEAMGLVLFIALLTYKGPKITKEDLKTSAEDFQIRVILSEIVTLVLNFSFLVTGFVLHLIMG